MGTQPDVSINVLILRIITINRSYQMLIKNKIKGETKNQIVAM